MWSAYYWPERAWPGNYWPGPFAFATSLTLYSRARRYRPERWEVYLVAADGTRYACGAVAVDAATPAAVSIPGAVPDGAYAVEIVGRGVAWDGLIQKSPGSVVIDRASSSPIAACPPPFSNLRYSIAEGFLKLLWDGEIPLADSGLVSAGIWLSSGAIDFESSPDFTIPVFSSETTHQFILDADGSGDSWWAGRYWPEEYWPEEYWLDTAEFNYAGVAPVSADGTQGDAQTIALPNRSVAAPPVSVEAGS